MSFFGAGQAIGLIMIVLGLLSIFARDFFWRWEKFGDALRGKRSERTGVWDLWQILKGLFIIGLGLTLLAQGQW